MVMSARRSAARMVANGVFRRYKQAISSVYYASDPINGVSWRNFM